MNLLLIEDDLDLATTVVDFLALSNCICDYAANGVQGLDLASSQDYDAILLDLNLPRLDGLSVCKRLRELGNDAPVLMLTARDQLKDTIDGFHAGTDDFLVKPFALDELLVRVQALTRRRSGQVKILRCADLEMNLASRELRRGGKPLHLAPASWKLLETLMRESPKAVPRKKLLDAVWGDEQPDSNSLKVHMFNLRKVVDRDFDSPLLHTIKGFGFAVYAEGERMMEASQD